MYQLYGLKGIRMTNVKTMMEIFRRKILIKIKDEQLDLSRFTIA